MQALLRLQGREAALGVCAQDAEPESKLSLQFLAERTMNVDN
jgi:hypothetical protein